MNIILLLINWYSSTLFAAILGELAENEVAILGGICIMQSHVKLNCQGSQEENEVNIYLDEKLMKENTYKLSDEKKILMNGWRG